MDIKHNGLVIQIHLDAKRYVGETLVEPLHSYAAAECICVQESSLISEKEFLLEPRHAHKVSEREELLSTGIVTLLLHLADQVSKGDILAKMASHRQSAHHHADGAVCVMAVATMIDCRKHHIIAPGKTS